MTFNGRKDKISIAGLHHAPSPKQKVIIIKDHRDLAALSKIHPTLAERQQAQLAIRNAAEKKKPSRQKAQASNSQNQVRRRVAAPVMDVPRVSPSPANQPGQPGQRANVGRQLQALASPQLVSGGKQPAPGPVGDVRGDQPEGDAMSEDIQSEQEQ